MVKALLAVIAVLVVQALDVNALDFVPGFEVVVESVKVFARMLYAFFIDNGKDYLVID